MEMKKENVNSRASLGATSNSTTSKLPLEVAVNSTTRSSSATSSNLEVAASGSSSIGSATCRNSASRGSSASSSELSVVSSSRGVIARGPHDFDGDHQLSICNSLSLHGAQEVAQFKPASTAVMRETKRLNQEFFEGKARIGIFRSSNHPFRRFLYFTLGIVLLANAGRRQWEMHKDIEEMGHERAAQKWCPRTIKAAADQQRAVMQKAQIIDDDGDEEDEDGPF
ncbi:unnamed protein product [Amoebophrya sp. A25]|nr:unnamed protein product [Amoebophrya sp. A25]|eukprot:GSA25T00000140001.1